MLCKAEISGDLVVILLAFQTGIVSMVHLVLRLGKTMQRSLYGIPFFGKIKDQSIFLDVGYCFHEDVDYCLKISKFGF